MQVVRVPPRVQVRVPARVQVRAKVPAKVKVKEPDPTRKPAQAREQVSAWTREPGYWVPASWPHCYRHHHRRHTH